MKKVYLFVLAIVSILTLIGCQKEENKKENNKNEEAIVETNNAQVNISSAGFTTVKYNGNEFNIGEVYEGIKERLGAEIKPAETAKVCNPNAKGDTTMYYYDGMTINTNYKGVIIGITITSDNAELEGGLKVGDSPAKYKDMLGEAVFESEYGANYKFDRYSIGLVYGDDGNIQSINLEDDLAEV